MESLVFKLLVEVGDYGLSVHQCMRLRCVNRWARDQIPLKQFNFQHFLAKSLSLQIWNSEVTELCSLTQGIVVFDDQHVLELSPGIIDEFLSSPWQLIEAWNNLRFKSDLCVRCLFRDRAVVISRLEHTIRNRPKMCVVCWGEQPDVYVARRNVTPSDFMFLDAYLEGHGFYERGEAIPCTTHAGLIMVPKDLLKREFPEGIFDIEPHPSYRQKKRKRRKKLGRKDGHTRE